MRQAIILLAAVLGASVPGYSTILVFDQCGGDPNAAIRGDCSGGNVNVDYGDRATSTSANGGLFRYIEDGEGWTPNVVTDYGPDPAAIYGWYTGYRPLADVLWVSQDVGILSITLQADPGYSVLLYNFQMAIFTDTISSLTVGKIGVTDQDNTALLDLEDHTLRDAETFFFFTPAESAAGGSLTITYDVTNLPVDDTRELVAIDNIRFGQVFTGTPEPGSLLVAAPALLLLLAARKRLRR